jgi:protein dithiol:quinone oxidoreductase
MYLSRKLNLLAFLTCLALLLVAFYLQYQINLQPCSLCIIQRGIFVLLALVLLLAVIQNPKSIGIITYGTLTIIIACFGVLVAGRQVWLQYQPPQAAEVCIPGLTYLFKHLSWSQAFQVLWQHSASCREVWTLIGLTIPQWTLIAFIGFILFGCLQIYVGRIRRFLP